MLVLTIVLQNTDATKKKEQTLWAFMCKIKTNDLRTNLSESRPQRPNKNTVTSRFAFRPGQNQFHPKLDYVRFTIRTTQKRNFIQRLNFNPTETSKRTFVGQRQTKLVLEVQIVSDQGLDLDQSPTKLARIEPLVDSDDLRPALNPSTLANESDTFQIFSNH
ncbi:hypothetical protein WN51_12801 [Melipona quadrifasciata]|uniref:Uncharacterized protein n=1 Tax=Melipona quadrifasciata TaxID=166423 RepID=A0A0N0BH25_9HYME|nr:hypothetical protein WN51_12801 [Melipona quadrifasciata]